MSELFIHKQLIDKVDIIKSSQIFDSKKAQGNMGEQQQTGRLKSFFNTLKHKTGKFSGCRNSFLLILVLILMSNMNVFSGPTAKTEAAPKNLGTSTSSSALGSQAQKKTFYDTVGQKHWSFYYNGSDISYSYSADGESWNDNGNLPYNTSNFALTYKVISGNGYVFFATECNSYDICIRRGSLGATAITFGAESIVFNGDSDFNKYIRPAIALDENNQIWVSAIKDTGVSVVDHLQVFASRSTNINDVSAWNSATSIGRRSSAISELAIMPQGGSRMYLLMNCDFPNIVGYKYDGSSWSDANDGGDYSEFDFPIGIDGTVRAFLLDGSDVYLGGGFGSINNNWDNAGIVRWNMVDGGFHSLAGGIKGGSVYSLTKNGTDILIGGSYTSAIDKGYIDVPGTAGIAKWNSTSQTWSAFGTGVTGGSVQSIDVVGTDIYVGGYFTSASGVSSTNKIARYDLNTQSWNSMDGGIAGVGVSAITHYGSSIYVGGSFSDVDGDANADNLVRYDSTGWHSLSAIPLNSYVSALGVTGDDLYVGGNFTNAGNIAEADFITRFNLIGSSWSALGTVPLSARVNSLSISGTDIYITGTFTNAGNDQDADLAAKFNGTDWQAIATGIDNYTDKVYVADGKVFLGGGFRSLNTTEGKAAYAAYYEGSAWHSMKCGAIDSGVSAITVSGTDVYIGGEFSSVEGIANTANLVRLDTLDGTWHAIGAGLNPSYIWDISAIEVVSPTDIYVGGDFDDAGGDLNADHFAHFNGTSWGSLSATNINSVVNDILADGNNIYIGGSFTNVGADLDADYVMRWDKTNSTWNKLSNTPLSSFVNAIAKVGSDIYLGGRFINVAGDANADRIIRWDGSWQTIGTVALNDEVYDLLADGTDLYVGGYFNDAGSPEGDKIVRLDTTNFSWHAVGTGIGGYNNVESIGKSGDDLFVGGWLPDYDLQHFDGTSWGEVGDFYYIYAIDNMGPDLFIGSVQEKYFAKVARAAANDTNAESKISSVTDNDGNVHMSYVNKDKDLIYKQHSASADKWDTAVTLKNGTVESPSLSLDPATGDLYNFWIESGKVYYKKGVAPYGPGDWDTDPTEFYGVGTNFNLVTDPKMDGGIIKVTWENGDSAPYILYSDYLGTLSNPDPLPENSAPNAPTQLNQGVENGDYIATGASTQEKNIYFSAEISDPDVGDTLYLCVEQKPIGSAFTNVETSCGAGVSYSGNAVVATLNLTLADGDYHWQVRAKDQSGAYSSWLSFGSNNEAAKDFSVITLADSTPAAIDDPADAVPPTADSIVADPTQNLNNNSNAGTNDPENAVPISAEEKSIGSITGSESGTKEEVQEEVSKTSAPVAPGRNINKFARFFFGAIAGLMALSWLLDRSFMDVWAYLYRLFLTLLEALGLRKKRAPWGTVYDSITKEPVSLSIIRAFDTKTGKIMETNVTDEWGRYGFLLLPGEYRLNVRKQMYNWSSKLVPKGVLADDIYSNIYHGENFDINDEQTLANFDTPADPINFRENRSRHLRRLFRSYFNSASIYLFSLSVILSFLSYYYYRQGIDVGMSSLGLFFIAFTVVDKRRHYNFGQIYDAKTKQPIVGAIVKIFDAKTKKQKNYKVSDEFGRFGFLMPPGSYYLDVDKAGYSYPSRFVTTKNDGNFHNVNHGETFVKEYRDTLITANIPIDKND